jgi:hypothetical protein
MEARRSSALAVRRYDSMGGLREGRGCAATGRLGSAGARSSSRKAQRADVEPIIVETDGLVGRNHSSMPIRKRYLSNFQLPETLSYVANVCMLSGRADKLCSRRLLHDGFADEFRNQGIYWPGSDHDVSLHPEAFGVLADANSADGIYRSHADHLGMGGVVGSVEADWPSLLTGRPQVRSGPNGTSVRTRRCRRGRAH